MAGNIFTNIFTPQTNLQYGLTWNGRDIYGRHLAGKQPVEITIGYTYQAVYGAWALTTNINSFGQRAWQPAPGSVPAPPETFYQSFKTAIGLSPSPKDLGVGGWKFNVHHSYDPVSKTIFLGDGGTRQAENLANFRIITTVAGNGTNV